jgi:MFS family permease
MVGRAASEEHRSLTLGVATAAGSMGQVIGPPIAEYLLGFMNWSGVFFVFAVVIVAVLALIPFLRAPQLAGKQELEESMSEILGKAFRDPSFTLIFLGFFSCGYQLAFVTAHFPAFVTEACSAISPTSNLAALGITTTSRLGALAISIVGLANIAGTILAGYLGKTFARKYLLAIIYSGRTLVAAGFILLPMTPVTVLVFSGAMGFLWLATVPVTSGLIGYIYGMRYMGTLYGIVFFSHQVGSFLGVWLGGKMFDIYGNYDVVWWVGVGVGAFSALISLPIKEVPLGKRVTAPLGRRGAS